LQRRLDAAGIEYSPRNIWEDADAAAWVRSVNRGNETVPTLDIAGTALTNPTIDEVRTALSAV
jgi:mycoredoxin